MAMRHAQAELYGDDDNLRAMLRFADEEVKHQKLFQRFLDMFHHQFPTKTEVVPSPQAVAEVILAKSPMAVTLVTLHLELKRRSVGASLVERVAEPVADLRAREPAAFTSCCSS
jgi:hypothetical protein